MENSKAMAIARIVAALASNMTREQVIRVMGYVEGILAGKSLALA